jgi:NADP-dependent aldehyde dehydrogenase
LGPVAVFGASNFPLAFSVAGGDTASAFAAGCPVVVKAHSSHPGTSELVGSAIQKAVADHGLNEGVFSLLFGSGKDIGSALVSHPAIKAVGFTGSEGGGTALMRLAAARPEPIPVYAEMSSINPVFLLPNALAQHGAKIGADLVASMMMGAGQFCTGPGLIIGIAGKGFDQFIESAKQAISDAAPQTMLSPRIHSSYEQGVSQFASMSVLSELARGEAQTGSCQCRAALFEVTAHDFLANTSLREEVFGSCSLIVRCETSEQLFEALNSLRGQLTGSIHATEADDTELVSRLIEALELKVGRIIWNGFGTGVEVCHAMVHGGPYPATSDGRSTSVGTSAIERFLRPVCYQNMPGRYLPATLDEENSLGINRLVNGEAT